MSTNNYLKFITKVEEMGSKPGLRTYYHVGSNFIIEVSIINHEKSNKYDLMNLWVKNGCVKEFLSTHIYIDTYYTDNDGNCWGRYNIQHTRDHKIDFNYILEATQENINFLLNECIRMYEMNI